MDLCEPRKEEAPPPKMSLCEEDEAGRMDAAEHEPSCLSLRSDISKQHFIDFQCTESYQNTGKTRFNESIGSAKPSCLSCKSDSSKQHFTDFKQHLSSVNGRQSGEMVKQETSKDPSVQSSQQHLTHLDSVFKLLEETIVTFVKKELEMICKSLIFGHQKCSESEQQKENLWNGDRGHSSVTKEAFLKITVDFLRRMKQEALADRLLSRPPASLCQHKLKSNLKKKFQCVLEGISKVQNPTPLNEIYTELHITEGGTGQVNDEHEVRQIETTCRKQHRPETTIKLEDLFKLSPERAGPIRTVMTKGVAGIGKTVLTQKFTLDWAEDKANQDIQFTFPFTFRELNLLKEKKFSLVELIHHFFSETKDSGICKFEDFKVVFIFDGLDECRLPLDFHNNEALTDATRPASVDVLLTNLIKGKLLPSACLWITTRPAAANQIPPECVDMLTEVRGFNDPQKEEYFRKRFKDKEQAKKIISHIKTSRSLHIMCHIPVFCWISATVLEDVLKAIKKELPKTLTEMFIHFLVVQSKRRNSKYDRDDETDLHLRLESRKMIESLGKLAFEQLQKGNLIFYESDLMECGISIKEASWYSGVFTQFFKEDLGLYQDKVFCFIHLSVQEFLAAFHVHVTFTNSGVNLLLEDQTDKDSSSVTKFFQTAVDKSLESPNGHLDLFLRFLLGLSLQTNKVLLEVLLAVMLKIPQDNQGIIQHIKEKMEENPCPERSINLFHCLHELNDHSLVEQIQRYLGSGRLSKEKLSPAQWSALAFILLSSEKDLEVFDLEKYSSSDEAILFLVPVVKASKKVLLRGCGISNKSCEALSSVLCSQSSSVRELDLSNNFLQEPAVNLLSIALESPNSQLETLRLNGCNLSGKSCEALSSVLKSKSSSLRELDLSNNNLQDSGVTLLSSGLRSQHCTLKTLRLSGCLITEKGCASLAAALKSNPSHLRELDLSYNHPGQSGIELLSAGLKDPQWGLGTLRVEPVGAQWLRPGLKKYSCELTLDANTVNRRIKLSNNNRKFTFVEQNQPYSDHPDRFDFWCPQLLCRDGLTGCCYWEVEWTGGVKICMTYRGISRTGNSEDCLFGATDQSWTLSCSDGGYSVWHNNKKTSISASFTSVSYRVGVYVDCPAGTLSFYRVSSESLIHLHTFNTSFTEPLYPGFGFWTWSRPGSSVSLCPL